MDSPEGLVCFCPPTQHATLEEFVQQITQILTVIAGTVAVLLIVFGGFIFMTSGGNEEKVQKGKSLITWGIIGFIVILLANAIWSMIQFALTG